MAVCLVTYSLRHNILKNQNLVVKWLLTIFFLKWDNQLHNHLWHNFWLLLQYHSLYDSIMKNNDQHHFSTATHLPCGMKSPRAVRPKHSRLFGDLTIHQNLLTASPLFFSSTLRWKGKNKTKYTVLLWKPSLFYSILYFNNVFKFRLNFPKKCCSLTLVSHWTKSLCKFFPIQKVYMPVCPFGFLDSIFLMILASG